jgi:parallel beta-helix repeat protein
MKKLMWIAAIMVLTLTATSASAEFYVIGGGGGVGTKITSLPYTITAPGFYYLAGNLTYTSGIGITIEADDVTLDLMGFCLSGSISYRGIFMNGRKNVEIRNGSLRGWHDAIYEQGGYADDDYTATSHRIINIRAEGNYQGIYLLAGGHLVKGCTASNNTNVGIHVNSGTISGNVVHNNYNFGISMERGTIIGNTVFASPGGTGTLIYCSHNGSIIGNTVTCNTGQTGIYASMMYNSPVVVDQNSVSGAGTRFIGGTGVVKGTNAGF